MPCRGGEHDAAVRPHDKTGVAAQYGFREVWIVNLIDRILQIHREPYDGAYRVKLERDGNDIVAPVAFPNAEVRLSEIW